MKLTNREIVESATRVLLPVTISHREKITVNVTFINIKMIYNTWRQKKK